jgi:hypothetical protein
MKTPWTGKTGFAKAAVIFAVITFISVGLCAGNAALFSHYGAVSGGTPEPPRSAGLSMLLMGTGGVELLGMAVGVAGLIVVLICVCVQFAVKAWKVKD